MADQNFRVKNGLEARRALVENIRPTNISGITTFYIGRQEDASMELFFGLNGRQMYVLGDTGDDITQYSLSTPWSVSTASYTSEFSVSAQGTSPSGLYFKPDGTRFYVLDYTNRSIFQYSCTVPWNTQTASYSGISTSVASQDTNPTAIDFKPDGTKFYVMGNTNDRIYQYSCSTAWDVNTSSYDSVSFSVTGQETDPQSIRFSQDGTKLLVLGTTGDDINQYQLATPWNISTASFVSVIQTLTETVPTGMYWKPNATKLYILGQTSDTVYEYNISSTGSLEVIGESDLYSDVHVYQDLEVYGNITNYSTINAKGQVSLGSTVNTGINTGVKLEVNGISDLSIISRYKNINSSYFKNSYHFYVGNDETAPVGIDFKSDGTVMYVLGDAGDKIFQYSLATPWRVGTATSTTTVFSVTSQDTSPSDLKFKSDGTKFFISGTANDRVYEYAVSTPWNLTTAGFTTYYNLNPALTAPSGLDFSSDGTKMVVIDSDVDTIFEYDLVTPWSVNTAVGPNSSFYVGTQETGPGGIAIDPSGQNMYVTGYTNDRIYQYSLTTPFDLRTATYTGKNLATGDTEPRDIFIKPDGSQIFIIGNGSDLVRNYNMSSNFDLNTAVAGVTFSVTSQDNTPLGLWFRTDGSQMYIVGDQRQIVYQYALSSSWDISTAGLTTSYSVASQTTITTQQVAISSTGSDMYILSNYSGTIDQYSLTTPWNVSSATTGVTTSFFTSPNGETNFQGMTFNSTGTDLYLIGITGITAYQYKLSTPWDIKTASYNGASAKVSGYELVAQGIRYNRYGTKLFYVGSNGDKIYQYGLTTPYRLSTSYYEKEYYIGTEDNAPTAITFGKNDEKLYLTGTTNDTVWEYDFAFGTNESDLAYISANDDSFYVGNADTGPVSVYFRPDGLRMFVAGTTTLNSTIYQYELTSAWDIRTSKYSKRWRLYAQNIRTLEDLIQSICFKDDGTIMFVIGGNNQKIYAFKLDEAWDLSSISGLIGEFYVGTQDTDPRGIEFSSDGTYMYLLGNTNDRVYQYTLSTPWDVRTAISLSNFNVTNQETTPEGFAISKDGTKFYVTGSTNKKLNEYLMSTPWLISTAVFNGRVDLVSNVVGLFTPREVYLRPDKEEIYVVDDQSDRIFKLSLPSSKVIFGSNIEITGKVDIYQDLSAKGNISGYSSKFKKLGIGTDVTKNTQDFVVGRFADVGSLGTRTQLNQLKLASDCFNYYVPTYNTNVNHGITFKPDGTRFYTCGSGPKYILEYTCTTPWDIKTAQFKRITDLSLFAQVDSGLITKVIFKPDGTKVYVQFYSGGSPYESQIIEFNLNSAWDITSIKTSGNSLNTTKYGAIPYVRDFAISPDGTRILVNKSDGGTSYVVEFVLGTAWNISTASFSYTLTTSTGNEVGGTSWGIFYGDSGKKLFLTRYTVTENTDGIYTYNLKTPYNLSTAVYSGVSAPIFGYDNRNIFFRDNGKDLYTLSSSDWTVRKYTLGTAWNIDTIKRPTNFSGHVASKQGMRFNSDGTKLWVIDGGTSIWEYSLKEPYNLSDFNNIETQRYISQVWSIASAVYDVPQFSPDGRKSYAACHNDSNGRSGTIELTLKTPYDLTSIEKSYVWIGQKYLSKAYANRLMSVALNLEGTKLYELDYNAEIYEHDLTIPWDLSSARRTEPKYWSEVGNPFSIGFGTDGSKLYILNIDNGLIYESETSDLTATYDVRTMGFLGITTITDNTTSTRDFAFSNDGTKLYTIGESTRLIYQRTLTNSGNIRASTLTTSFSVAGQDTQPRGFTFSSDGTSLYVVGIVNDRVYQYTLSTPFSVNTAGFTTYFSTSAKTTQPEKIKFDPIGSRMYILGGENDTVFQYSLSTLWNVATAGFTTSFYVGNQETTPYGFTFNPSGTRMYISGPDQAYVWQYELSVPWVISTASYTKTTLNITPSNGGTPSVTRSLRFSNDGYSLYYLGHAPSTLYQCELQVPWKVSTATSTSSYALPVNAAIYGYDIDFNRGKVYIVDTTSPGIFQYEFPNYSKNRVNISSGLEVYGNAHFNGSIDVESKSTFKGVGIGTTTTSYSSLTVAGNSNLQYISPNEADILNYTRNSEDSFWLGAIKNGVDFDSEPQSLTFNDNGSRMYVCDNSTDTVYQYFLDTAWDVKTARLETGLLVATNDITPVGIAFSATGYSLYVVGQTNRRVYQYDLSSPFDLSTAGFTTYFSVSAQEASPQAVGFSTSGNKMYVMGYSGDNIYEYALSTPWRVNSATYTTLKYIGTQELTSTDFYFKPDGTKVWLIGLSNSTVFEYNLTTAWDISTLTYAIRTLKIRNLGETNPTGMSFSPDGKNLYITGYDLDRVWRYKLSTPWDIGTAKISRQSSYIVDQLGNAIGSNNGFDISSLGHKLYAISGSTVYEYDLTIPWNVGSLSYTTRNYNAVTGDAYTGSYVIKFNPDGTKFYTSQGGNYKINEYTLSTPWNVTTAIYTGSFSYAGEGWQSFAIEFSQDGTSLYFTNGYVIFEYILSTPWSVVTAKPRSDSFPLVEKNGLPNANSVNTSPAGLDFKPDGTRMYWVGIASDRIYQNNLATAWQVNSAYPSGEYFINYDSYGFKFKDDGNIVYVSDYNNKLIKQYALSTSWDVTTISGITTQFSTAGTPNYNPTGLNFKPDGTKMYVLNYAGYIYEYNLGTAWSVDTATYNNKSFYVADAGSGGSAYDSEGSPIGMHFSSTGKTLYITGASSNRIHQYKLDVAWDIASIRPVNWTYTQFNNDFSVARQIGEDTYLNPRGIYIKPDETQLYFVAYRNYSLGMTNRVWQFELTKPGDILSARLNNKGMFNNYLFRTDNYIESTVLGMSLNGAGTRMYLSGNGKDFISELELTIPNRIDSAVVTNRLIRVGREYFGAAGEPRGIVLKKDGTKMYFSDQSRNMMWELDLPSKNLEITANTVHHGSISVDYKISSNELKSNTATLTQSVSIGSSTNLYNAPLTVYGKSDIRKIENKSNFNKFTTNNDSFFFFDDITPAGVAFKPDGTSMYVIGSNSEEINQYSLTTPWDLNTATFLKVKSLSGITVDSRSLSIKPDGSQFYIMDLNTRKVVQLTATTPWDVATTGFTTNYSTTEDTGMSGVHIGTSGTTMYTTGYTNDRIYQYSLSTAWNVSTAGFTTQFSIGTGATTPANTQPEGIFVNPTETKVYTTSVAEKRIYEYTLSTPSNVGTASLTTSFALQNQGNSYGMTFNPNGREFYITNDGPDKVFKYTLTTPYTLSTVKTPRGILNIEKDGDASPYGTYFRPDGTKVYVIENGDASQDIFEYDLSTAWELNTASLTRITNLSLDYTGIDFKPDGTKMYLTKYANAVTSSVDEYALSTPWNTSTAGLTTSFVTGADDTQPVAIKFNPEGTRFHICGTQRGIVYPYELTIAWDLKTARKVSQDFYIGTQETAPTGMAFKPDGNTVYVIGTTNKIIYQYTIPYGYEWDVRYASYSGISTSLLSQDTSPQGIVFKPDGTKFYMVGTTNDTIFEYNLATAWTINTASYSSSLLNVSSQTTDPLEIRFNNDGSYLYVLDNQTKYIFQYRLTTPWSISTAIRYGSFYFGVLLYGAGAYAFDLSTIGDKLYICNTYNYRIYQFNLTELWNINTATSVSSYRYHRDVSSTETQARSVVFKPDGTQFSLVGQTYDTIVTYKLAIPWEISSSYYDGWFLPYDTDGITSLYFGQTPTGISFNSDGSRVYFLGATALRLYEWNLSEPYKLYSAKPNFDFWPGQTSAGYEIGAGTSFGKGIDVPRSLSISPDNEKFFIAQSNTNDRRVYEFKLPTESVKILNNTQITGSLESSTFKTAGITANSLRVTDTITDGDITLNTNTTYNTTLQTVTPTSNRTILLPNATGIVALVAGASGQIPYNNVGLANSGGNLYYDSATGTFGYGSGGGTVTQATSKGTGVTLDKVSGNITMNASALNTGITTTFTLTNNTIGANDLLILNHVSGGTPGSYLLNAQAAAGSASINVRNITAGNLSEAIVIRFAVIKGSIS